MVLGPFGYFGVRREHFAKLRNTFTNVPDKYSGMRVQGDFFPEGHAAKLNYFCPLQ